MNVQEILNISKERKSKDKDTVKQILDNVHKKIKFYATLSRESCSYQIPPIVNNKPIYKPEILAKKLFKVLDSEGYIVTAYSNGQLDIFWNEKLVEQKIKTDAYLISQEHKKLINVTKKHKKVDERFAFIANPKKTSTDNLPKSIDEELDNKVQQILKEKDKLQKKFSNIINK